MEIKFVSGQRWLSDAEPELGPGSVVTVDNRQVRLYFPSSDLTRQYACDNAPLRRIHFKVGDRVIANDGRHLLVKDVTEEDSILVYHGKECSISESDLGETMDFSSPEHRLLQGKTDDNSLFNLRFLAHEKRAWLEKSPVRGLLGARISLLPHQLYIASEISRRYYARVLLGDEVGLGKTIEAALILHWQIVTGLSSRALIVLPESLTHQWFLELWRRFNLTFSVFDEERCKAIEVSQSSENPFFDSSWIICSLEFLVTNPNRGKQACAAGWDMLIVDEAHHLIWNPGNPSLGYQLVEEIARRTPSVLLLSGTPEQLGETGHFARLHLLDPRRFHDLQQFKGEQDGYVSVVGIIDKLLNKATLDESDQKNLSNVYNFCPNEIKHRIQAIQSGNTKAQDVLISELVDRHGTSRLFYRNQRTAINGFPKRLVELHPLILNDKGSRLIGLASSPHEISAPEFQVSLESWKEWWLHDPRVEELLKVLENHPYEKVLVICAKRETVQALREGIERRRAIPLAVFHEELPLMVRDRQAAYFAEPDGARLLICSEIGSEGRNFQFCHHLILFDLPINPELLEQRIGRLDRIGQKNDVHIHVFFLKGSAQEVLAHWYHDGLDAFCQPLRGANEISQVLSDRVRRLVSTWSIDHDDDQLQNLIDDTKKAKKRIIGKLAAGRDRLLEWHSYRPDIGAKVVEEIDMIESSSDLAIFMENLCQHLGVCVEDHDHNSLFLLPSDLYRGLPGLPEEGLPVTFSRQRALAREDMTFLSWEHPMVVGGMDQLLSSWDGRVSYGVWEDPDSRTILLETIFLVYSLARPNLRPERFLPPTPLRILVNHKGKDLSDEIGHEQLQLSLADDPRTPMLKKPEVTNELVPSMVRQCRELAEAKKPNIIGPAIDLMRSTLKSEIERLTALLAANAPVQQEEIDHLQQAYHQLHTDLKNSVMRLDAIRFVWRGPFG